MCVPGCMYCTVEIDGLKPSANEIGLCSVWTAGQLCSVLWLHTELGHCFVHCFTKWGLAERGGGRGEFGEGKYVLPLVHDTGES